MMKKTFMAALMLMASAATFADEYNYLTVSYGANEESISLPTISKITFSDGNVVVTTSDASYTYPLSELSKMTFTSDPTAIKALPEKSEALAFDANELTVNGDGMLHIYNASGALVQMAYVKKGANINLSGLKSGLYIVNMGKQTIKIKK